jgi:hypothetical protein
MSDSEAPGVHPRWCQYISRDTEICGVRWDRLPVSFRRLWCQATDQGQHEPSPEFTAQMPALLAAEQAKLKTRGRR